MSKNHDSYLRIISTLVAVEVAGAAFRLARQMQEKTIYCDCSVRGRQNCCGSPGYSAWSQPVTEVLEIVIGEFHKSKYYSWILSQQEL